MALCLPIVSQGSVLSSKGLSPVQRLGSCCRPCNVGWFLSLHKNTMKDHTNYESPNENVVPRVIQLLVPLVKFTSGDVVQYFCSLLRLPLRGDKNTIHQGFFCLPVTALNVDHVSVFVQNLLFLHSTFINQHHPRPTPRVVIVIMPEDSASSTVYTNSHSCD